MREHITAVKWDPDVSPYAFLFLRNIEKNPNEVYKKAIAPNHPFNVEIYNEKICIGHSINKEEYYLCSSKTKDPYVRCFTCEQRDFERCFLFCDANKPFGNCTQNSAAYEYCKNYKCSVYLALIGNEIKVGVSFNPRKRWINQGADVAIEVFRAKNGFEARVLERDISKNLNISQSVRKANKAQKLNYDISKSLPEFHESVEKVRLYLETNKLHSEESDLLYIENNLSSYYGNIPGLTVNPIVNNVQRTMQIVGNVIGVKGKLLVTKVNSSYYVTNLSKLIGHTITFSKKNLKLKGQKSLSDFLG